MNEEVIVNLLKQSWNSHVTFLGAVAIFIGIMMFVFALTIRSMDDSKISKFCSLFFVVNGAICLIVACHLFFGGFFI